MSGLGNGMIPFLYIGLQGLFDFFSEIYDRFIAAFTAYFNTVIFKIDFYKVKSDTFGYTDAGAELKRE